MISVPPNIQYQLGDAIGVIADSDFWERWDTLVDVRTNHAGQTTVGLILIGSCFTPNARQACHKQWCSPGCSLYLQTLATSISHRRAVYRDQPCVEQIWATVLSFA